MNLHPPPPAESLEEKRMVRIVVSVTLFKKQKKTKSKVGPKVYKLKVL